MDENVLLLTSYLPLLDVTMKKWDPNTTFVLSTGTFFFLEKTYRDHLILISCTFIHVIE